MRNNPRVMRAGFDRTISVSQVTAVLVVSEPTFNVVTVLPFDPEVFLDRAR